MGIPVLKIQQSHHHVLFIKKSPNLRRCFLILKWGTWSCTEITNDEWTMSIQRKFRKIIFQLILLIDGWSISCKIVLKWMPMDLTDGKSTLVQVMAWCRQATSHYLSECWPRSLSPYGFTRPQCVNTLRLNQNGHNFADDTLKCIFLTLKSSEALNPRELCYYISRSRSSFVFIQIWLQCITWGPIKIISFDSGNGLALNRQQALTWISDDPVQLWK